MSMMTHLGRGNYVDVGANRITLVSTDRHQSKAKLTIELRKGSEIMIDGAKININNVDAVRDNYVRLAIDADKSIKIKHERTRDRAK